MFSGLFNSIAEELKCEIVKMLSKEQRWFIKKDEYGPVGRTSLTAMVNIFAVMPCIVRIYRTEVSKMLHK